MKIRVIDYQANPGGGVRFTTELLRALMDTARMHRLELVSHGRALQVYAGIFRRDGSDVSLRDIAPRVYWRSAPATRVLGIPGTGTLKRLIGFESRWYYEIPDSVLKGYDVVWFPWLQRHRLPDGSGRRIVGSFHDAIVFVWPNLAAPSQLRDERITVHGWVSSDARIVVSSNATRDALAGSLRTSPTRFKLIRVGWTHIQRPQPDPASRWPWLPDKYLLCPANTSPHKNHEALFAALAQWRGRVPVVLTGYGSDLSGRDSRSRVLRAAARSAGLTIGTSVIPLGLVSDDKYYHLLSHAWAVVMPTRMEGGGSFPVMEAVLSGIPVLCADIPVLREQIDEVGARVLWFDPADPAHLAARLEELDRHEDEWRRHAGDQSKRLRVRTWRQTAEEYLRVLTEAAGGDG